MATISETELQRRLRSLEKNNGTKLSFFVSDIDPSGSGYNDGDTHYNSATGNLYVFSDGSWHLSVTKLHLMYADTVTNLNTSGIAAAQNDITGFSELPYTAAGVQKVWRGQWFGGAVASTDPTDYVWTLTSGADGYTPQEGIDYDDGIDGNNIRIEYSTAATGQTWVTTQQAGTVYRFIRTCQDTNNNGIYVCGLVSKFIPEKGVEYDDGGTVAQITIYKRSATTLSTPTGGQYAFATRTLTPPTGWVSAIPAGTDPVYSCITMAHIVGTTATDTTLTWSSPESIISDGVAGLSVYTTNVFHRATTAPGTPVSNTGSFAFGTNLLSEPTGDPSTELWTRGIPSGTDPLYASEATFSVSGGTGTDSTVDWGAPRVVSQNGETGLDGLSTYLFSVFKRSSTAPAAPTTGGSYNFTTNTPTAPTGWFTEPPDGETLPTLTDPLYTSTTLASTSGPTGIDSTLTWSTPRMMVKDGYNPRKGFDYDDGIDGNNVRMEYSTDDSAWVITQAANTVYHYIRTAVDTNGDGSYTPGESTKFVPEHGVEYNSSYIHIKYSDDGSNFTAATATAAIGETVGSWLGTYADQVLADSTTFGTYTWKKIVGPDGYTPVKDTDYFDGTSSYLHVKYSTNGTSFVPANGSVAEGETPSAWIGLLNNQTIADSTVFSDYTWRKTTPTYERWYSDTPGLLDQMGEPVPTSAWGANVTWTQLTGTPLAAAPDTAFWVAERFVMDGLTSAWSIYPVKAKDGGIPFVRWAKSGYNMPTLGDSAWVADAVMAVKVFTGRNYTNQREFGYGTTVVIEYDDGKLSGRFVQIAGVDSWVAPASFIDGNLIVDGSIAAEQISATAIDATKLIVTGSNPVSAGFLGAATVAQNTAAAATANWSTVTNDNGDRPDDGATRNVFRGAWATLTYYAPGDIVTHLGQSFTNQVEVLATNTTEPVAGSSWALYAAKGYDTVSAILSNESHTFSASRTGVVSSYSNSGTTIYIYEGSDLLVYDGDGTSDGTWTVTTAVVDIVAGTLTDSGSYLTVGDHSSVTDSTDDSTVTYTITGKTGLGNPFSFTKEQTFSKSRQGDTGVSYTGTTEYYKLTNSTTAPTIASGSWLTSPQTPTSSDKYLWNYNSNTRSAGAAINSPVSLVTQYVEDGVGISSIAEAYAKSSSGTTAPTSWVTYANALPLSNTSPYLWNKTTTTYTDATTTSTSTIIAIKGIDADALTVSTSTTGGVTTLTFSDGTTTTVDDGTSSGVKIAYATDAAGTSKSFTQGSRKYANYIEWTGTAPTSVPTGLTYTLFIGEDGDHAGVLPVYADDVSGTNSSLTDNSKGFVNFHEWTGSAPTTPPSGLTYVKFVGETGPQGPSVVVNSSRPATFTATDTVLDSGQSSIVFTASTSGVTTPTYEWSFSGFQSTPTNNSNATQSVAASQFGTSKSATITCTVNGTYVDVVTIVRLEESTAAAGANFLDLSAGAMNNASLVFNPGGELVGGDGRPAGIKAAYSNSNKDTISYQDAAKTIVKLYSSSDTALGVSYPAFRVTIGTVYTVFIRVKSSVASTTGGFYFKMAEYDADLPVGIQNVGSATSEAGVVDHTRYVSTFRNDEDIGTSWETHTFTYIPTSTSKWASPILLNWTGMGNSELHIDTCMVVSDATSNQTDEEALLNAEAPTLGIFINQSTFTNSNPGEVYLHGFTNRVAADVDGYIRYAGVPIIVPHGVTYSGRPGTGVIIMETDGTSPFLDWNDNYQSRILCKKDNNKFYYDANTSWEEFTPTKTMIVIGEFYSTSNDLIITASVYKEAYLLLNYTAGMTGAEHGQIFTTNTTTIDGGNITTGTITADMITTGTGSNRIVITNTSIKVYDGNDLRVKIGAL